MTIIAFRDGIVAADTLVTEGSCRIGWTTKIVKGPDGRIGGACGDTAYCREFLSWIKAGGSDTEMPSAKSVIDGSSNNAIIVFANGTIRRIDLAGYYDMDAPYDAIGSGTDFALGAMAAGSTAEDAVRAAIRHNSHCGGELTVLRIGNE